MKKCKITVMRKACYKDLMKKYENPMEHACDMEEGQVFIANGWSKPDGMCDSAWESMSPFVMTLAYGGKDIYNGWIENSIAGHILADVLHYFWYFLYASSSVLHFVYSPKSWNSPHSAA